MRYIVVGLGKFGSVLAREFTEMGNEVIGVDKDINKVERVKSKISSAICLNITDLDSLTILPQKDIYAIVIAISNDIGECLTIYTVMKEIKGAKLFVRVADEIQAAIMRSLGITNIIYPEKESARIYAMSLEMPYYLSSYKVDDDHFIAEINVPSGLVGYAIQGDDFFKKFKLKLVTIKRLKEIKNELGISHSDYYTLNPGEDWTFQEKDILLVFGHYKNIKEL